MPLRKLWNSLRRRRVVSGKSLPEHDVVEQRVVKLESSDRCQTPVSRSGKRSSRQGSSHLCRTLLELSPATILEIGVGDGHRTVDFLTGMQETGLSVRYAAIDQFELAGGNLSLRNFHQMLRSLSVRPHLFPEPIVNGLTRFLHTIGSADVVLISENVAEENRQQVMQLLSRISNQRTTILQLQDAHWVKIAVDRSTARAA